MLKRSLRGVFRRAISIYRRKTGQDKSMLLLGGVRSAQNRAIAKFESLKDTEFSVFSQWGEDGIIDFLVSCVPVKEPIFIEIGVEDYSEANTRFLLEHRSWRGLILDGSHSYMAGVNRSEIAYKYDLRARTAFVTKENIPALMSEDRFGERAGLVSIDIDGVDYWVLEAMQIRPEIVVVEYNDLFDPAPISVPYDAKFVRAEKHFSNLYFGASLAAFRHLLEARGYIFVGSNSAGTNAFFVRNDVVGPVQRRLERIVAWPSQMREARDEKGQLVLRDRRTLMHQIHHLPAVLVNTGQATTIGEATLQR